MMPLNNSMLITGGAGFIGSYLINQLIVKGVNVICLDNFDEFYPRKSKENNIKSFIASPLFTLIEGDIRNKELLDDIFKKQTIGIVIHLAAKAGVRPSIINPQEYFDVNVNGTLNLLEVMKNHSVQNFIFASSSSIYGNNLKIPYSELDNVDFPISPYACSKKSGELLTHTYHTLYNMNVINLRFFTVYGPGQRPDLAIHKFVNNIYKNIPIEVYGDGSTSRDYTYIDDTVTGILAAIHYLEINTNVYETINLGNNYPVKLSDLIEIIEEITQKKFIEKKLPIQMGDVNITFADITKAKQLLNYHPKVSLKEGVINFKKWYEKKLV